VLSKTADPAMARYQPNSVSLQVEELILLATAENIRPKRLSSTN
jgi:hypothetical protein